MSEHMHVVWEVVGSATAMAFLGHALNTFPVPENPYGRWLIGCLQWLIGQRTQAQATRQGAIVEVKDGRP